MAKKINLKHAGLKKKLATKYRLSIINETNFEELKRVRVSQFHGILLLLGLIFIVSAITTIIIFYTPFREYVPGYPDVEFRRQVLRNTLAVDSAEQEMAKQVKFLEAIKLVIEGKASVDDNIQSDTIGSKPGDIANKALVKIDFKMSESDSLFMKRVEDEEQYNLQVIKRSKELAGVVFTRPIATGVVVSHFNAVKNHFTMEISALPNTPVMSLTSGTILYTGYTNEDGNVVIVLHQNNYISIYKHLDRVLKSTGNSVESGEAIGIIGNSDNTPSGQILSLSVLQNGSPVNPEMLFSY